MATSGISTYQLTANDLINAGYRKTGVMAKGQVADTEELTYGLQALNMVIAALRTKGLQLWKLESNTLAMVADQSAYTLSQPSKPAKIHQAWVTPSNSGTKIPLEVISIFNYNLLPNTSSGVPVKVSYQPLNTTGIVSLWPKPSSATVSAYTLYYESVEELEVVTVDTQNIDFPSEWYETIVYGIANQLSTEMNVPISDRQEIERKFEKALLNVLEGSGEEASLFVQPVLDR